MVVGQWTCHGDALIRWGCGISCGGARVANTPLYALDNDDDAYNVNIILLTRDNYEYNLSAIPFPLLFLFSSFLSLCTIFCIWIWSAPLAMNYFSSDILVFLHVLGPSYGFLYSRSLTTIMPVTNVNVALDKPARLSFSCSLDLLLISDQTNICRDIREGKCTWCCICLPLNACPCGLE